MMEFLLEIIQKMNRNGERGVNAEKTIELAIDEVLYGIRDCLNDALDDI